LAEIEHQLSRFIRNQWFIDLVAPLVHPAVAMINVHLCMRINDLKLNAALLFLAALRNAAIGLTPSNLNTRYHRRLSAILLLFFCDVAQFCKFIVLLLRLASTPEYFAYVEKLLTLAHDYLTLTCSRWVDSLKLL
jgi:hypothetical protein